MDEGTRRRTPRHRRPVVFAIEDDEDSRRLTSDYLEIAGFEVVEFPSGDAALSALETRTPDIILTDLGLPGYDGPAFMAELRRRAPAVKIVAFTGEVAPRALFDAFVSKASAPEALVQCLVRVLQA